MDRRAFLLGGGIIGLAACAKPQRDLLASKNIDAITLEPATIPPTTTSSPSQSSVEPDPTTTTTESPYPVEIPVEDLPGISFVANALNSSIDVSETPGGPVKWTFQNPISSGGPLVFLLENFDSLDQHHVLLPVRPNGTFGWVDATDVALTRHNYRLEIELDAYRITLFDHDEEAFSTDIGVARENTPTPHGIYYTTELIRPTTPNSAYGAYAYGLSGYSDVFTQFAGGPGQLGVHGTNDPGTIGTNVSHGCIRLRNEDISKLVEDIGLPVGVPVEVF